MSKTLIIVRHAKSSWSHPNTADIDRPLTKRGFRDAGLIGNWLGKYCADHDLRHLRLLVSPSNRTKLTAQRIHESLTGIDTEDITVDSLYLADEGELLETIREQNDNINNLMLIGHNPGMHALAEHLSGEWIKKFPTCAVACFEPEFDSWSMFGRSLCRNVEMIRPKQLRAQD